MRVLETGEDEGDDGGSEEDEDELVLELGEDEGEEGGGGFFGQDWGEGGDVSLAREEWEDIVWEGLPFFP